MARSRNKSQKNDNCETNQMDTTSKTRKGANNNTDRLSSLNAFEWYARYPELLEAAARVSFPNRPGMTLNLGRVGSSASDYKDLKYNIPGVCALEWIPALGYSDSATSPASVVSREIYSRVRSKFSGSLSADAPDFLIYIVAMDSVYSYIGALKRIYRILDGYSANNYVTPDVLLRALGITTANALVLRSNKADFLFMINELVRMSRKFNMPGTMDYFTRHYWMNDNVYTDDTTINSQFYTFVQHSFYKFALKKTPDNIDAGGLELTPAPWQDGTGQFSITDLYNYGANLINALAAWDESYDISGYLGRAYEDDPKFVVDILAADEEFQPAYVPEVLAQIENSRAISTGTRISNSSYKGTDVTQDPKTNTILYTPAIDPAAAGLNYDTGNIANIMSLRTDVPDTVSTTIASRLMCGIGDPVSIAGTTYPRIICGTEIAMGWFIHYLNEVTNQPANVMVNQRGPFDMYSATSATKSAAQKALQANTYLTAFDWAPLRVNFLLTAAGSIESALTLIGGDIHNLTTVTDDVLANIHKVCTYSEFNAFSE